MTTRAETKSLLICCTQDEIEDRTIDHWLARDVAQHVLASDITGPAGLFAIHGWVPNSYRDTIELHAELFFGISPDSPLIHAVARYLRDRHANCQTGPKVGWDVLIKE